MPKRLLQRSINSLHFVAACLVGGPLLFLVCSAGLVYALLAPDPAAAPSVAARLFSRVMQRVLGWRIVVENREGLPGPEPAVVLLRHQSSLDLITFGEIYTDRSVAIGKKEVERIPALGWFWKVTGNVLVDRQDRASAIASIEAAAARARREGLSIWAAPEGHRNMDQTLLPLKKGVFHLAVAGQLPIVPVAVEPMRSVLDARRWVLRPGSVRIRVLPEVPTKGCTVADVDRLAEAVRNALQEAQDELLATGREAIL